MISTILDGVAIGLVLLVGTLLVGAIIGYFIIIWSERVGE
jgi:antibiotic biosynthesis monooxygenase (ABM) superfamily enzyme